MVNTNSVEPKEGKEPPANMVIQAPSPVPPARKGQQNLQGTKGKLIPTQNKIKDSPQVLPVQNGHLPPSIQTDQLVPPLQPQQQQQQQATQPNKLLPNQIPQKSPNQNFTISQNNQNLQVNQNPATKTQQLQPQQKIIIPIPNPFQQQIIPGKDITNLQSEAVEIPKQATISQVVISKLPVDTGIPPNGVIRTTPGQSVEPANQTINSPPTTAKLQAGTTKSSTDNAKLQPGQSNQQAKQITKSPVMKRKLSADSVKPTTYGTNPQLGQPNQQAKQITKSPVTKRKLSADSAKPPIDSTNSQPGQQNQHAKQITNSSAPYRKLSVDSVKSPIDGINSTSGQPIHQAKQILGQHITRKISQTQLPLSEQQVQDISKPQNAQVPNKIPEQVTSPTSLPAAQNALPNSADLQISANTETSGSIDSSGQYPKSIVKVAQNVLKSPLVKTKRPRDISASGALSVPSSPSPEKKIIETKTSSSQEILNEINPVNSRRFVMKAPPQYDSSGNVNDLPRIGDMLYRAVKSCPSSPEILPSATVTPAATVIVTPATPIIKEQVAPVNFKNSSQNNVSSNPKANQNQGPAKEVIPNIMQFPTVDVKQGGGASASIASIEKELTKINGSGAENSSILGRDEGLLTPAVPGLEPKIPGLITPPPSPPILSSLKEEQRNQITEDISETGQDLAKEVGNLAATLSMKLATEEKMIEANGQKERSEVNTSQKLSQGSTSPADSTKTPNIEGSSEDTSTRNGHLLEDTAVIKLDDEGNCKSEGVVLGKITLGSVADKLPRLDNNNNVSEYFSKLYGKELSALEAKFEEQVQQLKLALNLKQEELAKSKAEAEKVLKQSEERSRREHQELKAQSKKEQEELKERLEREKRELEEKHRLEEEQRNKKELEERLKREEEKEKQAVEAALNEKDASKDASNEQEREKDEDEEESEAESNKRKVDKLQMEILNLKQQNEEFEEMVREKHRRQIELELQIGELGKEITAKEAMVDSVKVELCYSKNETELTKARVKRMEEELAQYKEKVESLEQELDTSERELKRMEILQEKLQLTETKKNELQTQLDEVELERDEEIKIIQDALDEAAQEREELLLTFEKEIEKLNSVNAAREAQMLEDFEAKLRELELQHKAKLEEKQRQTESTLSRGKRQPDQEEIRQRIEKMKSELNSEWEDKLRNECSRLKGELDTLHMEEKHLAVESIKVQKEQELQNLKKTFENKTEDLNKEIATLKESLSTKDAFYHKELDEIRTRADRDLWDMRRKLQKLDESSYDRQQYLEDKHREDIERLREEYTDKMAGMESQLSSVDVRGISDVRAKLEKMHKEQMEHLEEQHRLSMERLRDELEAEKFQAAEEARVIVTKHHEYINSTLRDQLTEAITANTQFREEIDAIRFALSRREEVIRSLEEEIAKLRSSKGVTPQPAAGGYSSPSPFSHEGSQGSRSSQDRLSSEGVDEDGHRASGLLGKVFGGGWFSGSKTKDNTSPGSNNSTAPSKKVRSSS